MGVVSEWVLTCRAKRGSPRRRQRTNRRASRGSTPRTPTPDPNTPTPMPIPLLQTLNLSVEGSNLRLVSTQFLHLQISTFDKSSIPTLTHSRMRIASLSFPLYSYPPLTTLLSRRTGTRTQKTTSDIPEWFSGDHNKLLVLQRTLGISIH